MGGTLKSSFAAGDYTEKNLVDSYKNPGEMKTKSPGEMVIYHGELHRKHLVDS